MEYSYLLLDLCALPREKRNMVNKFQINKSLKLTIL